MKREGIQRTTIQAYTYALSYNIKALCTMHITVLQLQGQLQSDYTNKHTCTLPGRDWALLHTDLNEIHG